LITARPEPIRAERNIMEEYIGPRVVGMIAGDIEALLNENQSAINEAYVNVGKGFKISIGVGLSPAPQGVEAEIKLSFARETVQAPEKCTAKMKRIMSENQAEFELSTGGETILKGNTTDLARATARLKTADKVYRMEKG
jgi:hypothetical protein